jgi:hypothetical protein
MKDIKVEAISLKRLVKSAYNEVKDLYYGSGDPNRIKTISEAIHWLWNELEVRSCIKVQKQSGGISLDMIINMIDVNKYFIDYKLVEEFNIMML